MILSKAKRFNFFCQVAKLCFRIGQVKRKSTGKKSAAITQTLQLGKVLRSLKTLELLRRSEPDMLANGFVTLAAKLSAEPKISDSNFAKKLELTECKSAKL